MFFVREQTKKAVAYYRHSAEDKQENSVIIQQEHTQRFARDNNIQIIHEEADEGKSGLSSNRPGFDQLFNNWILNPSAPQFDYILVYDVSRWGRFQDQDEAAFWEFQCKSRGKQVIYISRGFPKNDQQLISNLQTSIERYMAAEYSRQLSEKVFFGSVKISEQGFSAGGTAPYGMVRVLLDENKNPIGKLKLGEHKIISNQRVTFAPASNQSTEVIKQIYSLLIERHFTPAKIANSLNEKQTPAPNGLMWNREKIIRILTNKTYTGTKIYNKTWSRLKQRQHPNPPNEWVICPNAFEAIIDQETFNKAQEILYAKNLARSKPETYTNNKIQKEFLSNLRELLLTRSNISEDNLWGTLHSFPFIVGSIFYPSNTIPHWFFTVNEVIKEHKLVLGVVVDNYKHNPTERFFLIPTHTFGLGNFFILWEKHPNYSEYIINPEDIKDKIQSICQHLVIDGQQ